MNEEDKQKTLKHMESAENIRKILDFDSLGEAEKITGKSYKEDEYTATLGFLSHIEHTKKKNDLLESLGDSVLSNTEENYLKIVKSIGFESVLIEPFINKEGIEERLHIMWHNEYSILLAFDTFTYGDDGSWSKAGKKVPPPYINGGKFYYNWSPNIDCKNYCTSSGSYLRNGDDHPNRTYTAFFNPDFTPHILPKHLRDIEPIINWEEYEQYRKDFNEWCNYVYNYEVDNNLVKIWSGNHDCREAIKFNISQLAKNGTFLKKWKEEPFLWLLHYMDTKNDGYDYEKINQERINKFPQYIKDCMGV